MPLRKLKDKNELYEDGDNQTGQANLALINSSLI
jgi:hypothetical protein